MAACSAAWAAPGMSSSATPARARASTGMVHQTALVDSVRRGRSRGWVPMISPLGSRRRKDVTWVCTRTGPKQTSTGPHRNERSVPTMSNALTDWAYVLQPGSPRTTLAVLVSRSSSVTT